jgi:hypothetical protein
MGNTTKQQSERAVTTGAPATERRLYQATRLGGRENTRLARLTETTGPDREAAHEWLAAYEPADLDDKTWGAVRGFVVECAARLIDEHDVPHAALRRKYVRALTKLARYCRSTHQELNVKTALDPYTVNLFAAAIATVEPASAATYQSSLRYIGERLCPSPLWERPTPVSRRSVPVPYGPAELTALETQIARNTEQRRRGGEALMALGLGAGLDGRWAAKVAKPDVFRDVDGLNIAVDGRVVPVLRAYERPLEILLEETPDDGLIVGGSATHKNAANEIANRIKLDPGCPKLNAGRLRSTWIVTHLTLGTRLPELAEAAGTVGITTFSDLLEFVPRLEGSDADSIRAGRAMLRGQR